jgi:hypothetical protein
LSSDNAGPGLSADEARLYAAVAAEDCGRRIEALVNRSPQILQILHRGAVDAV